MSVYSANTMPPAVGTGFSVVVVERVLASAQALGLPALWADLPLGHPSRRVTSYPPAQRVTALLATLSAGLRGLAPANTSLRPNRAVQAQLGGRFPDQGTMHRWLQDATADQATAYRDHLHQVVQSHGRFWDVIHSPALLIVDVDGQGLVARGQRFERAAFGYLGGGLDRGYHRYVCYAAQSGEVLDEFLTPGNTTLMSQFPEALAGLNAVLPRRARRRTVLRMDAHGGTVSNLQALKRAGYHYVCPPQNAGTARCLRTHVQQHGGRGGWFTTVDSSGQPRRLQYWVVRRWRLRGKGRGRQVYVRATVYHDRQAPATRQWRVLLTDLKRYKGQRLWECYNGRGGAVEEYNDQAERAYHLEVMRTGHYAGLQVVQTLVGLCWDLTRWALAPLQLPPVLAPAAAATRWVSALRLDLCAVLQRAAQSGLSLARAAAGAVLEVEDAAATPESRAWLSWLQQPIQLRLRFSG